MEKYLEVLEKYYQDHKILERLRLIQRKLQGAVSGEWKKKVLEQLDAVDKQRINLMIAAEKKVGPPTRPGVYNWSPSLEKAGRCITHWKLKLHRSWQGYVNPQPMERLKRELNIQDEVHTKSEVKVRLR